MVRGRPKRSDIPGLIAQGINSESAQHRCKICKRIFSRKKNLTTHLSTHSNVKKCHCDFPDCDKSFRQSSQLKNHQLTHTNEKPFICPAKDCRVRFRHCNRICPFHANLKLIKQPETAEEIQSKAENMSEDVQKWFEEYLSKRNKSSASAQIIQDGFMERDSKEVSDSVEKTHDGLMELVDIKEGSDHGEKIHDGLIEVVDIKEGSDYGEKIRDGLMEVDIKEGSDYGEKIRDGLMEVDIKEGSDNGEKIHDGLMEVVDIEEGSDNTEESRNALIFEGTLHEQFQDGILFCSFLGLYWEKCKTFPHLLNFNDALNSGVPN